MTATPVTPLTVQFASITPVAITNRAIRLFPVSATNSLPVALATEIPWGEERIPAPIVASNVPVWSYSRTTPSATEDTHTLPDASTVVL